MTRNPVPAGAVKSQGACWHRNPAGGLSPAYHGRDQCHRDETIVNPGIFQEFPFTTGGFKGTKKRDGLLGDIHHLCLGDVDRVLKPVFGCTLGHDLGEVTILHDILYPLKVDVDSDIVPLLDHMPVFAER